jgi:hypothetical protein
MVAEPRRDRHILLRISRVRIPLLEASTIIIAVGVVISSMIACGIRGGT